MGYWHMYLSHTQASNFMTSLCFHTFRIRAANALASLARAFAAHIQKVCQQMKAQTKIVLLNHWISVHVCLKADYMCQHKRSWYSSHMWAVRTQKSQLIR